MDGQNQIADRDRWARRTPCLPRDQGPPFPARMLQTLYSAADVNHVHLTWMGSFCPSKGDRTDVQA